MKGTNIAASVVIHVAVVGGVVALERQYTPPPPSKPFEVIYFEFVDEASPESPPPAPPSEPEESMPPPQWQFDAEVQTPEPLETVLPPRLEEPPQPDVPAQPATTAIPLQSTENQSVDAATADAERARVVSEPSAVNRIEPTYPRSARRKGHEGNVTVEVAIGADGAVESVVVVESSGFAELDASAVGAVRGAKFAPATEDGVGVTGHLRLTFEFHLK